MEVKLRIWPWERVRTDGNKTKDMTGGKGLDQWK